MAAEGEVNPEPKFGMKHTLKFLIIGALLLGRHLQAAEPHRYDLTKRASEIDPQAREHPEIKFTFTDDKGKPADLQHAVVDTRVPSQGKLVIWLMGHNQGLFERISSYGYHGIQPHYSNGWFAGHRCARRQGCARPVGLRRGLTLSLHASRGPKRPRCADGRRL
ncbi:MAG: hypothetical protein DVB28_000158 [Verrucomicrobia bacterium]|nr:MAG: hypothetical protein DVB28_000158 [Verrucomicrobiota bacterium]